MRSDADRAFVEAQVEVLRYLAALSSPPPGGSASRAKQPRFATPEVVPSLDGAAIASAAVGTGLHPLWLVRFLPGRPLAESKPHPPELLDSFGRALGELDLRLAAFAHPAVRRDLRWDLRNAPEARPLLECIGDAGRRELVAARLERAESEVVPLLRKTRAQVIHNDANDHNVLVDASGTRLTGLLDFGDMVHTHLACEPAVAMAYLMMNTADPIETARHFLAGYRSTCPLTEAEILLIPDLIVTRLCMSVALSSYRRRSRPENAYLLVSEAPAWNLLEFLEALDVEALGSELAAVSGRAEA